jgi:GTP-binding protein
LLHLVEVAPLDGSDPVANALAIEAEVASYSPTLMRRPRWVVVTKRDVASKDDVERVVESVREAFSDRQVFAISAISGDGIDTLTSALMRHIEVSRTLLSEDLELSAAEAALDAEIAGDVLRQSLARRPQRPTEREPDPDADDDADVEVVYRAE